MRVEQYKVNGITFSLMEMQLLHTQIKTFIMGQLMKIYINMVKDIYFYLMDINMLDFLSMVVLQD